MDSREIKEKLNQGWIHATLVIEVVGRPAEYIEEALGVAIEKLSQEKDFGLIEKKVHKAEKVQESKTLFSTFGEVEFIIKDFSKLIGMIFDYMPSSVEILEPTNISMKLDDANAILNDLASRLHQYDTLLKKLKIEMEITTKKIEELENKMKEKDEKE